MKLAALMTICVLTAALFIACAAPSGILTVTYDANGATSGIVPADDQRYTPGQIVAVLGNPGFLARTGITFGGWNTQADGRGTHYSEGSAFAIGDLNVTLYAHWEYYLRGNGPAGGWVFYDKGTYSNGWRYMEAAPADQSAGMAWSLNKVELGTTSLQIGTGQSNTDSIVGSQGAGNYAAQICSDLIIDGYYDWFLPSAGELGEISTNLAFFGVGGLSGIYWSSSEYSSTKAWYNWLNRQSTGQDKYASYQVRAVRVF